MSTATETGVTTDRRGPQAKQVSFAGVASAREKTLDQFEEGAGVHSTDGPGPEALESPASESFSTAVVSILSPGHNAERAISQVGGEFLDGDPEFFAALLAKHEAEYGGLEKQIGVRIPEWLSEALNVIQTGYNRGKPLGRKHQNMSKERMVVGLILRGMAASPEAIAYLQPELDKL
jgi:hypothetical protein